MIDHKAISKAFSKPRRAGSQESAWSQEKIPVGFTRKSKPCEHRGILLSITVRCCEHVIDNLKFSSVWCSGCGAIRLRNGNWLQPGEKS